MEPDGKNDEPEIDLTRPTTASDQNGATSIWSNLFGGTQLGSEQIHTLQTVASICLATLDFVSEILLFSQIVPFMCLAADTEGNPCCRDLSGDAYCKEGSFLWQSTFPRRDSIVHSDVCACEGGCSFYCQDSPDMDRIFLRLPYAIAKILIYIDFGLTMTKEAYNLKLVLKCLFSDTLELRFLNKPFNIESPSGFFVMILHPRFWNTCVEKYTNPSAQEIMLQLFTEDIWSIIASAILLRWPLPGDESTVFAMLSLVVSIIMLVKSVIKIRELNS